MSGLLGGKRSNSVIPNVLNGIQINQSIYGTPYPLIYGKVRTSPVLLWYGDFLATAHQQSGGGKGGGGQTTSYSYSAALIMGLCEGPITSAPTSYVDRSSIADHTTLGWSLALGSAGQSVWSYLTTNHPNNAIGYSGTAYVFGGPFQLGSQASVPNSSFEIVALLSNATYSGDAAPAAIISDYCTDPNHGAGFSSLATLTGTDSYDSYCQAMGFFLSPAEKTQRTAADFLKEILQITNSFAVWSGSQLKIIPYGDQAVTGNGVTWSPSNGNGAYINVPIYSFGDDDYLSTARPVIETRKPVLLAFNYFTGEYKNRSNAYNSDVATASDARDIAINGERAASVLSFHSITNASTARLVAQLILQRDLYYRNTVQFKVRADYCLLEAGDVVEITDTTAGIAGNLVRITEIQDDDKDVLTITAEELPIGPGHAPQYSWDAAAGYMDNALVSPGSVSAPCIFAIPPMLVSGSGGYEIGIAVAGTSSYWAGCDVFMSLDGGTTYQQIATIVGPARYGTLTATMPLNATDPDTTSTLSLNLVDLSLTLAPASQSDVDQYRTMMFVDGEIICYRDATLVSAGNYNLGYFHRGLYGSAIASHASASQWARIDQYLFRMPFDPGMAGQTATFKFCSFNIFGRATESLAAVTAYTHALGSVTQPMIGNFSIGGFNVTQVGTNLTKTGGAANTWDSQVFSNDASAGSAYVSAQSADVTSIVAFGLSSNPTGGASYTNIDYAWYLNAGTAEIYEAGTLVATIGSYIAGAVFSISWNGATVTYSMNGVVEHISNASPTSLYLDASFYNTGSTVKNLVFGPAGISGTKTAQSFSVVPAQYSLFQGAALPALDAIGCTASLDTGQEFYGTASIKVVVASAGATLAFAGFPIVMPANQKWFCSWQLYTTGAVTGSLAITTSAGNAVSNTFSASSGSGNITDDSGANITDDSLNPITGVDWDLMWGLYDLSAFPSTTATWKFTFNTPGTYWIDGLQQVIAGATFTGQVPFTNPQPAGNLDHIPDGWGYTKMTALDMTSNRLDFSKPLLGKMLDNIPDGSIFGRPRLAGMTGNVVDPSKGGLVSSGSIPQTVPGGTFTYTSTTTSITISWAASTLYRPDGTSTAMPLGSLTITGLSANTTYKDYPYWDDVGGTGLQFVIGGTGVGTPAACYAAAGDSVAAQGMYLNGRVPLNGFAVITPSSGTGSGGGGGKTCLHPDTLVVLADGSVKFADELVLGDRLPAPQGSARIKSIARKSNSAWVGIAVNDGPCDLYVTPDHRLYRANGDEVRATHLRLGDILKANGDHVEVTGLKLKKHLANLVSIELDAPHLYFVGGLLSHNPKP